jgi:hypothetical protein
VLLNVEFCGIVRYIVYDGEGSSPIRDKHNVVIRPNRRRDNTIILVYISIITGKSYLAELINYHSWTLYLWEVKPVFRVIILIIATGMLVLLMSVSNIIRILV